MFCDHHMMTSSNGNIFRVTGHLCGEFTGHRRIIRTKASDAELSCFDLRLNKLLGKQWWGRWLETPSRPLWRHCNEPSIRVRWDHLHPNDYTHSSHFVCCGGLVPVKFIFIFLGLYSLRRYRLTGKGIPIINLRQSDDHLKFIMRIFIPIRRWLLSEKEAQGTFTCTVGGDGSKPKQLNLGHHIYKINLHRHNPMTNRHNAAEHM